MFTTIIAYILTLILGPLTTGITVFILLQILMFISKLGFEPSRHKFIVGFLSSFPSSLIAVWIGTLIFSWLNREAGWLMIVLLLIFFLQNSIMRLNTREDKELEGFNLVGNVLGILLGAYFFI